jgi:hypothetical protein
MVVRNGATIFDINQLARDVKFNEVECACKLNSTDDIVKQWQRRLFSEVIVHIQQQLKTSLSVFHA